MLNPDGIAVDWISDKLYYHDRCHYCIGLLDLTTGLYKTLASESDINHYYYTDIIVDPTTRLVITLLHIILIYYCAIVVQLV